jgi:hypothetical protein
VVGFNYFFIKSRFNKKYEQQDMHLVGIFLRDHVEHVFNCQVLVTVPACLELLLFGMVSVCLRFLLLTPNDDGRTMSSGHVVSSE